MNHPSWSVLHSQGHGNAVLLESLHGIHHRTLPSQVLKGQVKAPKLQSLARMMSLE